MANPKTTIAGYLVLAGSILTLIAHLLTGAFGATDMTALAGAAAGVGLIVAKDGGH